MLHKFIFDGTRIVLDVHSGASPRWTNWPGLLDGYGQVTEVELIERTPRPLRPVDVAETLEK